MYPAICATALAGKVKCRTALKVKSLAMTRMLCHDAQLNTLDATIGTMLREGAQVDLTENQLTLATADQTLVYKLADLMH